MASTAFVLIVGFLIMLVIGVIVAFALIVMAGTCSSSQSPSYKDLLDGLDANCNIKSMPLRLMARSIYEYRSSKEFTKPSGDRISIFMASDISTPPPASSLSDIALFKLATAPRDQFSVLISYIPIFNHVRYVECLKSYSRKSETFKSIDPSRPTKDIIVKDVLGVGSLSRDGLKSTINNYSKQSVSASAFASIDQFIMAVLDDAPDAKIYELLQTGSGIQ
jgi:hypothetical protein